MFIITRKFAQALTFLALTLLLVSSTCFAIPITEDVPTRNIGYYPEGTLTTYRDVTFAESGGIIYGGTSFGKFGNSNIDNFVVGVQLLHEEVLPLIGNHGFNLNSFTITLKPFTSLATVPAGKLIKTNIPISQMPTYTTLRQGTTIMTWNANLTPPSQVTFTTTNSTVLNSLENYFIQVSLGQQEPTWFAIIADPIVQGHIGQYVSVKANVTYTTTSWGLVAYNVVKSTAPEGAINSVTLGRDKHALVRVVVGNATRQQPVKISVVPVTAGSLLPPANAVVGSNPATSDILNTPIEYSLNGVNWMPEPAELNESANIFSLPPGVPTFYARFPIVEDGVEPTEEFDILVSAYTGNVLPSTGRKAITIYDRRDPNADGLSNADDIEFIENLISTGPIINPPFRYDMDEDGDVDVLDRAIFLDSQLEVYPGDANLDHVVDVSDFLIWNANKFTYATRWDQGDFDGNGVVDVSDYNAWYMYRFLSHIVNWPLP